MFLYPGFENFVCCVSFLLHLNISAAGNFSEVLLLLQGLVHLVVGHAETAQASLNGVQRLCKDDKLGHVRNTDDLSVQLAGKVYRLLSLSAVYQPKPREISKRPPVKKRRIKKKKKSCNSDEKVAELFN